MQTYWNYEITVDGRCMMSAGDVSLSATLGRAIQDAVYYQAVYPDAKIVIGGIQEQCSKCHNLGKITVRRPRSSKRVNCPECKGKLAHGALDPIQFTMPDPANRITLAQA